VSGIRKDRGSLCGPDSASGFLFLKKGGIMILAECPDCHKKQSVRNKQCIGKIKGSILCEADLDRLKKQPKKVKYYISYRIPGGSGKQRMEFVGYKVTEARDADGKRKVQMRENRFEFDVLPESKMTFRELADWYVGLTSVKKLASYRRVEIALNNFCDVFENRIVKTIKSVELEEYQERRREQGKAPSTIDMELSIAKTVIITAFDNDMVSGRVLKAFRSVKKKLKKGANARKRILAFEEYLKLINEAPKHLKDSIVVAFNSGMRTGEIRQLKWSYIDRKNGFIRLPKEVTKEKKSKNIPINHHVKDLLDNIPRNINHGYVISYKGNPIRQKDGLKRSFRTACNNAKIPHGRKTPNGITFHDIRRTVKTNMLSAGVDKVHRDLILGHSLQGMDVHYMAPDEETLKAAMDKYTSWLDEKFSKLVIDDYKKIKRQPLGH
jgi:integrase